MIIHIDGLKLLAIIGTNDWERETAQEIVIDLQFEYDAAKAAETDDLTHAVDYDALTRRIAEQVERSRYFLLETLADSILQTVLAVPRIVRAEVRIAKPGALKRAASVSITCSGEAPA